MTDRDYLVEAIAREIHKTWCAEWEKHCYGGDDYERAVKAAVKIRAWIERDA